MSCFVLDASVIVAAVLQEPGGDRAVGQDLLVSAVNYAEARTRFSDLGMQVETVDSALAMLRLEVVEFDEAQANEVAELRRTTRVAGLSLGDRACLALAAVRGCVALTADRAWQRVEVPVQIEFVR